MTDAAEKLRPENATANFEVTIFGKLMEERRYEDDYYTLVLAAAPDEFSQPVPFEIRSQRPLGRVKSMVTVRARLGGFFRKAYNSLPDERTGEVRRIRPVVHSLEAIDAF